MNKNINKKTLFIYISLKLSEKQKIKAKTKNFEQWFRRANNIVWFLPFKYYKSRYTHVIFIFVIFQIFNLQFKLEKYKNKLLIYSK